MTRVVLELTDRCNLRCAHCFDGRHGGRGFLDVGVLAHILEHAADLGIREISLTGGEPTLHPAFGDIVGRISTAGIDFGFVSNGWNFPRVYPAISDHRDRLRSVTFSMDGATEETHDRIRGRHSWRRLLQAMSICVVRDIPFAVNMVLTRANLQEIEALVDLAGSLGARGVRFGHLIPTPRSVDEGLYLTHAERNDADERVHELAARSALPVALAPGSRTTELFPCEPLKDNEVNVDWRGRLTRCCHLSGQSHVREGEEVIGSLLETGLPELMARLREANEAFRREKRVRLEDGRFKDEDFFPCDYCLKRFDKVAGFDEKPIWPAGAGELRHRIAAGAARHRAGGT